MSRRFVRSLPALVALALPACEATAGRENFEPPAPEPSLALGEGTEDVSASAAEMMGKAEATVNPGTLLGIYERTDYASENRPSDYLVIQNHVRVRVEIRKSAIAAAIECRVEVGGATEDQRTLLAYGSSPIEVHDWGIHIARAVSAEDSWRTYGVGCKLDLPDEDWPYCVDDKIPEGYSKCVYIAETTLYSKGVDGTKAQVGKKIRN